MACKPSCPRFCPAGEKSVRSCCGLISTQPGAARVLLVGDITRNISHSRFEMTFVVRVSKEIVKCLAFKGGQLG